MFLKTISLQMKKLYEGVTLTGYRMSMDAQQNCEMRHMGEELDEIFRPPCMIQPNWSVGLD